MSDEPLLPCEICKERATVVILCTDNFAQLAFVHGVRCADHPVETCGACRIVGVTAVVAGG